MADDLSFLMEDYLGAGFFVLLGVGWFVLFYVLNMILRPRSIKSLGLAVPNATHTAYECGEVPVGEADVRFNFQFYVFALAFVIFDIMSITLFLWALVVADTAVGYSAISALGVCLIIIFSGFLYWARKGALTWF